MLGLAAGRKGMLVTLIIASLGAALYGFSQKHLRKKEKLAIAFVPFMLLKMEKRINSPLMSDVIRGLIGILRGDDQRVYFKMLTFDMRQLEQNNLKKESMKRPQAMQKYCMFMMFCILLIYGVVLVTEVVTSLGVLF